jgi:hypothetical protein
MKTMETASNLQKSGCSHLSLGGVIVCLMLASGSGFARDKDEIVPPVPAAPTPREIVERWQESRFPKQISDAQPYCTDFGWPIFVRMTANQHEFLRNFRISRVMENREFTDVKMVEDMAEGKSVLFVRFRKVDGVWKFNNVYIEQFRNVPIGLRVSYIYNHPEALKQRLQQNGNVDFDAGLKRFNDTTTGVINVLDIMLKLRQLSEHRN